MVRRGRIWVFQGRNEVSTHLRGVESMRPDSGGWRREQDAPVGASANILAAVGRRVYSFGGEFIASNITGTLQASQVFDVRTRSWSRLATTVTTAPLDATGADANTAPTASPLSRMGFARSWRLAVRPPPGLIR